MNHGCCSAAGGSNRKRGQHPISAVQAKVHFGRTDYHSDEMILLSRISAALELMVIHARPPSDVPDGKNAFGLVTAVGAWHQSC